MQDQSSEEKESEDESEDGSEAKSGEKGEKAHEEGSESEKEEEQGENDEDKEENKEQEEEEEEEQNEEGEEENDEEDVEEVEEVRANANVVGKAKSERLGKKLAEDRWKEPFPSGPTNKELLTSFHNYVSAAIWNATERPLLRCINHGHQLANWELSKTSGSLHNIIQTSGLRPLTKCSYKHAHKTLIAAFVERWQPETNTFHLPFGEMTITFEDVGRLLDIPVMGRVVECDNPLRDETIDLVSKCLGVSEAEVDKQLNKDLNAKMTWLKLNWGSKPTSSMKDKKKKLVCPNVECTA